jgi:hypothetical protein
MLLLVVVVKVVVSKVGTIVVMAMWRSKEGKG